MERVASGIGQVARHAGGARAAVGSAMPPRFGLFLECGAVACGVAHGGKELAEAEGLEGPQHAEEEESDQPYGQVDVGRRVECLE